jgi:hypothetical protein
VLRAGWPPTNPIATPPGLRIISERLMSRPG